MGSLGPASDPVSVPVLSETPITITTTTGPAPDMPITTITKPHSEPLHLLVIGAGVAGLTAAISTHLAGHRATILERAPALAEIGAGFQLTPNGTRLLARFGVIDALASTSSTSADPHLDQKTVSGSRIAQPTSLTVRRFDGTRVLCREEEWGEGMWERYGAPFWDVHRADLQSVLLKRAEELGVVVRTGVEVVGVDFEGAGVTVKKTVVPVVGEGEAEVGEKEEQVWGDVVLAADGLWSRARSLVLGVPAAPLPTGDLAYRIVLRREELRGDPELEEWVANPQVNFWVGPGAHVVGYSLRGGSEFNLVLLCPDNLPEGCSRVAANLDEMRERFRGWDPILTRFLSHVKTVEKWKLMHFTSLEKWNHDSGLFTMAGDACHPMLPYLAQGANSAIEDGAVLGRLLGAITTREEVPLVLETYQALRKARVEEIAKQALRQRWFFHLPDGPAQADRDRVLTGEQALCGENPSRWSCPIVQPWLFGYDAIAEADKAIETMKLAIIQPSVEEFDSKVEAAVGINEVPSEVKVV